MRKKLLSILLAGAMLITQVTPLTVFADDDSAINISKKIPLAENEAISMVLSSDYPSLYNASEVKEYSVITDWTPEEKAMYVKLINNLHKNINIEHPELKASHAELSENVKWSDDLEHVSKVKLKYQYDTYFATGKGFQPHVYHEEKDYERIKDNMNGIFMDTEGYDIGNPEHFYLENESYTQTSQRVFGTALNIYDIVSRYLTEKYNPHGNSGHATALLGAAEIGSAYNVMGSSYTPGYPHAIHEIVSYKGNSAYRTFNCDSELAPLASEFFLNDGKVRELLKDPEKSSSEPADYSKFNKAYDSIPFDVSAFTPEHRTALNDIQRAAINLDRNLKSDEQDYIDCYTLAINKIVKTGIPADYSRLDEALNSVPSDLSVYTDESIKKVEQAKASVVRNLKASEQAQVDQFTADIKKAVSELEYKKADYSKVEQALKNIPEDLSPYTQTSSENLRQAEESVIKNLPASEQKKVDAFAENINKAITELAPLKALPVKNIKLNSPFTETEHGYKIRYTGKKTVIIPEIKDGGKILQKGTDYIVHAEDSFLPGSHSFTIEGKGDYTGITEFKYVILPPDPSKLKARLSTAKGGYNDIVLSWNKVTGADGYYVQYRKSGAKRWSKAKRTSKTK